VTSPVSAPDSAHGSGRQYQRPCQECPGTDRKGQLPESTQKVTAPPWRAATRLSASGKAKRREAWPSGLATKLGLWPAITPKSGA